MQSDNISSNLQMSNSRLNDFDMGEQNFGVLTIKVANVPMSSTLRILDSITDNSGSMIDRCFDGRTKMAHAAHVLHNVINTISNNDASVSMASYSFDNITDEIFTDTTISSENADELCLKIDRIRPRNGTDISQTLVCLKQRAESRDSGFKQTAIILTDGLANAGITDVNVMKTQLSDKCNNIFIGLGVDHDDRLLQQLASTQLGNNYFYIQEIEKAGLVFGEILHELLYTVISNIEIRVTGGEIYNYATNKWENELKVHALTSDAVKTYHIRSADESAISIAIYGCIGDDSHISLIEDDITPVPVLLSFEGIVEINNLARHVMRQKVLESLFEAHKYSMNNVCDSTASALIYKNLSELYANIKKYMADNMLETNEYYTMMCDDLSITLETLHHEKAAMYSGARQTSQGRQMAYNISQVNRDHLKNGRQPFEPAAQHALSAYTSCEQGRVMRECSQDNENPHIGLIITGLNVNKYIGRINTNI